MPRHLFRASDFGVNSMAINIYLITGVDCYELELASYTNSLLRLENL